MPRRKDIPPIEQLPATKAEAISKGSLWFCTRLPCAKRGHVCARRTADGKCVECVAIDVRAYAIKHAEKLRAYQIEYSLKNSERKKEYHRRKRIENPELVRAIAKRSRDKNKHKVAQRNKDWSARNPGKAAANTKAWRDRNPGRHAANVQIARAERLKATPSWVDRAAIRAIFKEAALLTISTGIKQSVDHIIPMKHPLVCGLNVPWNLRIIPWDENHRKKNKLFRDMALAIGLAPVKFYSDWDLLELLRKENALHLLDQ